MATISISELKGNAQKQIQDLDAQYKALGYQRVGGKFVKVPTPMDQVQQGLQLQNLGLQVQKNQSDAANIPLDTAAKQAELDSKNIANQKAQREMFVPQDATSKSELSTFGVVRDQINDLKKNFKNGDLAGVGAFGTGTIASLLNQLGIGNVESGVNNRALIGNIKATIAKLRGGTSFTPNEEKLLDSYVPTINDSPRVIAGKLSSLDNFINEKEKNTYKANGINIEFKTVQEAENAGLPKGTSIYVGGRRAVVE